MNLSMHNNILNYEQFIAISESIKDNTGYATEYWNGEIIYFSPSAKHSRSIYNILKMLDEKLPSSCVAISELHIKFKENEFRIPDISVFCGTDIKDKFENDLLHLEIPKLIFEVLSETTEKNDREYKMELYSTKGIVEYLLVDYRTKTIEQYYLKDNCYVLNKNYMEDDVCSLLLYPHIKFITSEVFKLFMQG
ncbi:Uma2 family endonuclease [Clostridium sp. CS001]|uniref:Uma2 family endonuclease n=1 Tax=Clostridium sp. CS001 TaxID=2880648 RepID=UPI001CF44ED8|nr:Uma2 family endonuclease [Clostridium sp. CS001]MCB2290943.1 Uma2 family endonuclease [Clostridium sp. CS001]